MKQKLLAEHLKYIRIFAVFPTFPLSSTSRFCFCRIYLYVVRVPDIYFLQAHPQKSFRLRSTFKCIQCSPSVLVLCIHSPFISIFVVKFFSQGYLMFPSNKINGQKTCLSNPQKKFRCSPSMKKSFTSLIIQ